MAVGPELGLWRIGKEVEPVPEEGDLAIRFVYRRRSVECRCEQTQRHRGDDLFVHLPALHPVAEVDHVRCHRDETRRCRSRLNAGPYGMTAW